MKNRKLFTKKILSCLLVVTSTAFVFTGCGKKNNQDSNSAVNKATQNTKDYVFAQEQIDIGVPATDNLNKLRYVNGRIYTIGTTQDGKTYAVSFNPDGSDVQKVNLDVKSNAGIGSADFDAEGNMYAFIYTYTFTDEMGEAGAENEDVSEADSSLEESAAEDASTKDVAAGDVSADNTATEDASVEDVVSEEATEEGVELEDGDKEYFVKYDNTGKEVFRIDAKKALNIDDDYLALNGIVCSDKYGVIASIGSSIYSYDDTNGFKPLLKPNSNPGNVYYTLYEGADEKFFVSYYGDKGFVFASFDPEKGEVGKASACFQQYGDYSFFYGIGYDIYVADNKAVFGYDTASDKMTKLMDYMDSDLESTSSLYNVVAVSDQEFIGLIPDIDYNFTLCRLTKIPPEEVVEKTVLTLAGSSYVSYDIRRLAMEFNKKNQKYKIKTIDYSELNTDENWNAGAEQMNLDIISGNTPDIIFVSDDLPIDSYINKGLFVDLTPYVENDKEFSTSDFLPNVLEACKTNGKLYQIVPSFKIGTMVVKSKFTEGKETLSYKDCNDLINKVHPNKEYLFGVMNRDTFMEQGLMYAGSKFIDWDNKKCNFDNESFTDFLELAKSFPEEFKEGIWDNYKDSMFLNDESLFQLYELYNFRDYAYLRYVAFGTDVSFVGFPNDMGVNYSSIIPTMRLGISSQCKDKEGAWEFLREVLTESYQNDISYGFPVRTTSFELKAEEAMHKPYYMDGDKKIETDDVYYIDGTEVVADPLTKEDVAFVSNFIKQRTELASYNKNVNDIIKEEASAFFSGQKTAKEVAGIIQSRLSIYVNENS